MNLEIKQDSTHTFTFPDDVFESSYWQSNQKTVITSATIEITDALDDEIQAVTNMTISGDTYSATYNWDSTDEDIKENYIVKFVINGVCYNRFFDIYLYPFQNTVTDDDLFAKDSSLKEYVHKKSGKADSGTITTLVDSNRIEDDNFFNGGVIEIYFNEKIEKRNVADFVSSTNTITFTPAVYTSVSEGIGYSLRESFQNEINEAGKEVQLRFRQMNRRAYLLIDHTQVKELIVFKTLANYWHHKVKSIDDEYHIKYNYYFQKYESLFTNTVWKYDTNADGTITDDEANELTQINWKR